MTSKFHIGQRLSYQNVSCTVRYVGLVEGTDKEWLGVEWDDPLRGKHDGELKGKRYFSCLSSSKTAASFIRPSRVSDPSQSFVEAVHQKYSTEHLPSSSGASDDTIHVISGKVVEEVGFDKIRHQLAQLQDLKIVIVDGARINEAETKKFKIRDVCPKIVEMDLSRNLFESFQDVVDICGELDGLRSLRVNGNRFTEVTVEDTTQTRGKLKGVTELELDDTLLSWNHICTIVSYFPSLRKLEVSSNALALLNEPLPTTTLKSITLEYNNFTDLSQLRSLSQVPALEVLLLKGNRILSIGPFPVIFPQTLKYLDISYNAVTDWSLINYLTTYFPGLTSLRFAHNPIYINPSATTTTTIQTPTAAEEYSAKSIEEGYMLTLARIAQLKVLNFSTITTADRTNAEMYYLSCIGKELSVVAAEQESDVVKKHPRYGELVEMYGEPAIVRRQDGKMNTNLLEARLIKFTFYDGDSGERGVNRKNSEDTTIEIPKSFDVYRVKGIVGRAFSIPPLGLKLTWETGEWDPVAGYEDDVESSDDDESGINPETGKDKKETVSDGQTEQATDLQENGHQQGRWMKREVEIMDGTRQIGFWVEGSEAIVRVERR